MDNRFFIEVEGRMMGIDILSGKEQKKLYQRLNNVAAESIGYTDGSYILGNDPYTSAELSKNKGEYENELETKISE